MRSFCVKPKFHFIFIFSLFVYINLCVPSPYPPLKQTLSKRNYFCNEENLYFEKCKIELNGYNIIQIHILCLGIFTLLWLSYLHLCNHVRYVSFNTNLNLYSKKKNILEFPKCIWTYLSLIFIGLLLSECENEQILLFIICMNPDFGSVFNLALKFRKLISWTLFRILSIYMFSMAVTPAACILCLMVYQIWCHSCTKNVPHWLSIILILLSNDVHLNPGPHFQNNFFNFMSWNVNSLAKENFKRVRFIEADNTKFNYDLISLCETSLNDSVELPETLLNDYTFVPANHPANTRHGGVGLFFKNSLPVIVRNDLSFDESIVVELKFGRKKIFFTILYRSPAFNYTSPEFQVFLSNFENLYLKIKAENPFATFFTGDFNAHSKLWWSDGVTTPEGRQIEDLFTSLGLSQIISEPTNFEPSCNPSCIDLIVTDQPNLILDSGTRDFRFILSPSNNSL